MIGTTLGPYRVLDKLGAGGMGEIYRALDTRLDRQVAIKVLPPSMSDDPDRLARFEREAKAVAALSHPNILAIYDVGVVEPDPGSGSTTPIAYAVTELLEGETLRARIDAGALTVRKTVEYAVQIARGLAAAHDKNIVHRDIKPENIFLLADGQVKILDFGLARVAGGPTAAAAGDATETVAAVTNPGTVLGTFGYMSPEQVRGQVVDGRSDLFSLGAVLYEMVAGARAFKGETAADTMTAILKDDPPEMIGSRVDISPALDRIIRHCLEKIPAERFQSARDVAFSLGALSGSSSGSTFGSTDGSTAGSTVGSVAALAGESDRQSRAGRPAGMLVAVAAAVALAIGGAAGYLGRGPGGSLETAVTDVTYQPVTFDEGFVFAGRFAQDGRTIVFSADWEGQARDVFVTSIDGPELRPLGFAGADLVALSASGELAVLDRSTIPGGNPYVRSGTLSRASLTGGALRPELESVSFADFAPDGAMAVVRRAAGLSVLDFPVGTALDEGFSIVTPRVSPDGAHVAVFFVSASLADITVRIYERAGRLVAESGPLSDWWSLAWTPDGEVWFAGTETGGSQTALFGLDLTGRQRLIYRAPGALTVHDISADGALLASFDQYRSRIEVIEAGAPDARLDLSWKDGARPVGLSDDHALLFNQIGDSGGAAGAVYIWRRGAPQPVRIADGFGSAFSADGRTALVGLGESWSLVPTGAGQPRPIDLGGVGTLLGAWWHPDGRLVISGTSTTGATQAFIVAETGAVTPLLPEGFSVVGERAISPDGTRIVAVDPQGASVVCGVSVSSAECAPITGLGIDENVAGWAADNASLFVFRRFPVPVQVDRLEVTTGRRTAWRTVEPVQAAVSGLRTLVASPDGTLAYSYSRARTQLYVIRGLK